MFETIVVGTDGSPTADKAVRQAADLVVVKPLVARVKLPQPTLEHDDA